MKICFLARPSFDYYSTAIFKKLVDENDKDLRGVFVTCNEEESDYVRKALVDYKNFEVYDISLFVEKKWDSICIHDLIRIEECYNCKPIWKYIYADRFLIKRDYEYAYKTCVCLFYFFEDLFKKGDINFYYSEGIATLLCYAAYLVGKKYGVEYVSQVPARGNLDSRYHYFVSDEYQHNALLSSDYLDIDYSEEEMQNADEYLSEFESHYAAPPGMKKVKSYPRVNIAFFLAPLKYLVKRFDKRLNNKYSYIYYKTYSDCLNPIRFYFRFKKFKHVFVKPDYSKKYVLFPLHFQPEASTIVCAQKYEKQLFLIDSLAKSLPSDTVLYVKEHYALIGHRSPRFYEELKSFPNVFVIGPSENTHDLIVNSECVVTLTGTVAYEAMLLGKKALIGGSTMFDNAPGIIKFDDIYGKYVELVETWVKPTRTQILKYLCACIRAYKHGNARAQNFPELLNDNINDICSELYTYLISRLNENKKEG